MPATDIRRIWITALSAALAALVLSAAPAWAQLHQNGVARQGPILESRVGGTAFMCRTACSIEAGCQGWSWTRPGASGPEAQCRLLSGVTGSSADSCCESGELRGPAAPQTVAPALEGDRYAGRATQPTGPPVELTSDPSGGMWDEEAEGESEEAEAAAEAVRAAQAEPQATETPAASIARRGPPGGGRPTYSVQREYAPPPVAQAGQSTAR